MPKAIRIYTPEQLKTPVRVPAGECPISFSAVWPLPSIPPPAVIYSWFWQIRDYGLDRGEFLMAEAIAYWARNQDWWTDDEIEYLDNTIYDFARLIADPYAPAIIEPRQEVPIG